MSLLLAVDVPTAFEPLPELDADPGSVAAFADDLLATAVNLDDLDTVAHDRTTLRGWTGPAAEAYGRHVRDTGADAHAMSAAVRRVARAVDDHADALTGMLYRRADLAEARTAYHASRADLLADIRAAAGADGLTLAALEDRAAALTSRRDRLRADLDALVHDLGAAERTMVETFGALLTLARARAAVTGRQDLADQVLARPGSPASGGTPGQIAAWWRSLSADEQIALLAARPELIGGTDGIPARVRDRANRLLLETDLEALDLRERRGEQVHGDRRALANARAAQAALVEGAARFDPITGEALVPLLHLYDSAAFGGDGRVAIAFGDPDAADHVSVLVPGLGTTGTSATRNAASAFHIYESARFSDPRASAASILWIGYDAPSDADSVTVVGEGRAAAGGDLLSRYVDGLRASREGPPAHLTVIGHSYGSTTTAHGATGRGLLADDIVLVGSPGAGGGVTHASELGIGADRVWAGNNSRDPVAALADNGWVGGWLLGGTGLGNDVAEDTFGANRFQAESTTRAAGVRSFGDHSKYFDPDTESLHNIGQIVVGDHHEVRAAEHTYDPWWGPPQDPEARRTPTTVPREPEW